MIHHFINLIYLLEITQRLGPAEQISVYCRHGDNSDADLLQAARCLPGIISVIECMLY